MRLVSSEQAISIALGEPSVSKMLDHDEYSDEITNDDSKTPGAPGTVVVAEDPAAPSKYVSSKRQSLSDLFTIVSVLHR